MSTLFHRLDHCYLSCLQRLGTLDFIAPLLLRLFLAPVFFAAGWQKLMHFEATVSWFGNADWGLGLPLPWLLAVLAIMTELVGGVLLLLGLATRLVTVPLIITMLVAIASVHWQHGWFAVAPSDPGTNLFAPLAALGVPAAQRSLENSAAVGQRLTRARSILREHGDARWLTEKGRFVVLNNGIEFAATYLLMLLVLLFQGGGRFVSLDHWWARRFRRAQCPQRPAG